MKSVKSRPHLRALSALHAAQELGKSEAAHSKADGALIDFLTALGYADIVIEWQKVEKWYA